jgi:hypothetical protein
VPCLYRVPIEDVLRVEGGEGPNYGVVRYLQDGDGRGGVEGGESSDRCGNNDSPAASASASESEEDYIYKF